MPGFGLVTGNTLVGGSIADDKAVFVGIGCQPFALRRVTETFCYFAIFAHRLDIGGKTGLVFAVARTGALGIGNSLPLGIYITAVKINLIGVLSVAAGEH